MIFSSLGKMWVPGDLAKLSQNINTRAKISAPKADVHTEAASERFQLRLKELNKRDLKLYNEIRAAFNKAKEAAPPP